MAIITCPADCEEVALPAFQFDECKEELNSSQIMWLYIALPSAPAFTDVSDPVEWATRLGNLPEPEEGEPANPAADIRFLKGIGDKPKPTSNTVEVSGRRTKVISRTHSLTFRVDNTNQVNHDGMRLLQCGGDVKIWYGTIDGLLFGGNDGIKSFVDPGANHGGGNTDVINHEYAFQWTNLLDPERVESPL